MRKHFLRAGPCHEPRPKHLRPRVQRLCDLPVVRPSARTRRDCSHALVDVAQTRDGDLEVQPVPAFGQVVDRIARDRDVDSSVFQRQAIDRGVSALDEEVWRQCLVSRWRIALCRGIERQEQGTTENSDDQAAC